MDKHNWQNELGQLMSDKDKAKQQEVARTEQHKVDAADFFQSVVKPAFEKVAEEFKKYGRTVSIHVGETSASIRVNFDGREELNYSIKVRGNHPYTETISHSEGKRYRAEGSI